MSVRPPRQFSGRGVVDPIQASLEAEVLEEKALTLARTADRLERALGALAAFEAGRAVPASPPKEEAPRPRSRSARDALRALTHTADLSPSSSTAPRRRRKARGVAPDRESLLNEAAEALWNLIIQRELMGLGGEERVCRDYRVPPAVRARLGVRPARREPVPALTDR